MYNVLIADDEQYICSLLKRLIPWETFKLNLVGTVNSGEQVLEVISDRKVDILLTDIRMPGIDGIMLLERLSEKYPGIQVIIISGYDDFLYAQKAVRFGAVEYVLKPVEAEVLSHALRSAIQRLDHAKQNSEYVSKLKREISILQQTATNQDMDSNEAMDDLENCHRAVLKSIKYIEENYNQDISMEEAAGAVFMNPAYFSQLFKREVGIGFKEYLTNYRIEKAKLLLKQPFLKINDVANLVGYRDIGYFGRIFKARTGYTPSEYKETKEVT